MASLFKHFFHRCGTLVRDPKTKVLERNRMNRILSTLAAVYALTSAGMVSAQTVYNTVPAGDGQYRQCLAYASKLYDGGKEASPIKGQTKEQAWCTCLWNETPDEFSGNLVKFSESAKGKRVNKICEAYSNWHD